MTTLREAAQQALEALESAVEYDYHGTPLTETHAGFNDAATALKAALAEPTLTQQMTDAGFTPRDNRLTCDECGGKFTRQMLPIHKCAALAEPMQEPKPVEFDHGIGADRFKVVRGAFWWHVLIGDSPTEHGKFRSQASAEKMAADLLREFRNGAFVQREAALAEPVQEPVAWRFEARHIDSAWGAAVSLKHPGPEGVYMRNVVPLYTAPPQPEERNFCPRCGKRNSGVHTCTPPSTEPQCNPHPKAPHGFLRNASHTEDRYVCECEGWEPYEAGYQAGMEAALRAQS